MPIRTEFARVSRLRKSTPARPLAGAAALAACVLGLAFGQIARAGEGESFPAAGNDIHNTASLQRGARNFINYCSGCHSAQYVRYNRIGADLGIPEQELRSLIFNPDTKSSETIKASMSADDAKRWFGNAPPDLSLIARSRGTDYIAAFLKSFYLDPTRPTGVNNRVLAGTAMPHVLASLQGVQTAEYKTVSVKMGDGSMHDEKEIEKLVVTTPGSMTPAQYDEFVRDTVNFLAYIGEPGAVKRQSLGVWVVLFLLLFTAFAYGMKKEYWKDVK